MSTTGVTIPFGKHKGTLLTRVPVSYLRWMMNERGMADNWKVLAREEFERRGDTMPTVELSGHAIDNASLRVRKIWHQTKHEEEGLYSWLSRITLEAIKDGKRDDRDPEHTIHYLGLKLVIEPGEEFPSLKTIMTSRREPMPLKGKPPTEGVYIAGDQETEIWTTLSAGEGANNVRIRNEFSRLVISDGCGDAVLKIQRLPDKQDDGHMHGHIEITFEELTPSS